jgi:hypothetical protein
LADEASTVTFKCLLGVLFACCTLQFVACHREASNQDIDAEIRKLVEQTVSAGGTLIREAQVSRTTSRVEADWQIATRLNRRDYLNALRKTFGSEYQVAQQTDSELTLRRLLPGDAYVVRIAGFDSSGDQQTLNVHFVGRPD